MSTRLYMLVFILSRMLNPLSYTVFLLYFVLIAVSGGTVIPKQSLVGMAQLLEPLYFPLVLTSIVATLTVFGLLINFLYRVIVDGKYIVKLSTLGLLLAMASVQLLAYFCTNALPKAATQDLVQRTLTFWFNEGAHFFELMSLLFMGMLLALYVGVLGREKFKKNIGFVDDTLCE